MGVESVGDDQTADWAASGLASLTGAPDRSPDFSRAAVLAEARHVAADIAQLLAVDVDAATILAGRAALLGLNRRGRISVGGATRLLATADSWCAITLSRADDIAALPALVQADIHDSDPWPAVTRWAATRSTDAVVARTGLLDIAAAALAEVTAGDPVMRRAGVRVEARRPDELLVADLSSLWAGPLCGQLLARCGAVVVKVESPTRPDGSRRGQPAFFDWMNSGKLFVAFDFDADAEALRALLAAADIVIEGSRPAALRRRHLGPDDVPGRPGRVWLRIGGHCGEPDRPAFGDDAAVAGGLVGAGDAGPVFCGDAIADPLSGLEAVRAVAQSLRRGGGELIEVSMSAVAARYAALPCTSTDPGVPVAGPQLPPPTPRASPLGADKAAVHRIVFERLCSAC